MRILHLNDVAGVACDIRNYQNIAGHSAILIAHKRYSMCKPDIPLIMATIEACVRDLIDKGIYQWNDNYPTEQIINSDLEGKFLYLIKNKQECLAIIVINEVQDEEWKKVDWSQSSRKPLAVHRLLVHPRFQKRGLGRRLMDFALKYANENKYDSIRFDVYTGNPGLIDTYEKMGCVKRGEVYFPFRELPFGCYELEIRD